MSFVHLHVHSEYSALDGMIRISDAFGLAADMGQTALAITDHGNLAAAWAAQKHADKSGVKFIAGAEFYLAVGDRFAKHALQVPADDNSTDEDSERGERDEGPEAKQPSAGADEGLKSRPYMHITVLARNAAGWRSLVALNNKAQDSIWHKPRIDFTLLAEHAEGLIVLTGCLGGPVLGPMSRRAYWEAKAAALTNEYGAARAAAWTAARDAADEENARVAGTEYLPPVRDDDALAVIAQSLTETRRAELHGRAADEEQAARKNLRAIIDAVGAENTYVELMEHGIEAESAVMPQLVALAREFGVGIVATNDAHHGEEHGAEAHSAWLLVQSKSTFAKPAFQFHGEGFWLRTEEQMRALRPEPWWQEACDTTQLIADRCEANVLPAPRNLMPRFPTPPGYTGNREYLYALLRDGAAHLFGGIDTQLRERVSTEMGVIEQARMVDYFLVVHDLISWARSTAPTRPGGPDKAPILVGPGRGSAGGSMVAYLLGITQINPLRYGLLFERFYEAGRSEPPDIDIDFPQGRRQEVIQYLRDRWGAGNVASIGTFMIERTRKAITDAGRVIGESSTAKSMSALVPIVEAKPMPVAQLLNADLASTAEYRRLHDRNDLVRRIHAIAETFEDVISGFGTHASGVIVSSEPLDTLVPLRRTSTGMVLQWTGPEAEEFGLLKVDVLGLRNLDVIERTVEYVSEQTGEFVDPMRLPDLDNPPAGVDGDRVSAAWKLIADGHTAGVFQMESPKMTELAMQVAPRHLNEESAIVALYRPGPMAMGAHTSYANRKRGIEPPDYSVFTSDPVERVELGKVLDESFGLIIYQEQIMALGTVMAGFDAAGRSKLRKAVSKKKKADLEAIQPRFFEQATTVLRGVDGQVTSIAFSPVTVQAVWDSIMAFADYAFNKAHSATYGYLAFMTAYYKANWPAAFAAANLSVTTTPEKRLQVLSTLREEGITVLPPDVNSLSAVTAPEGEHSIRIGVSEIATVAAAGELIAAERGANGEFRSLRDLFARVQKPDGSGGSAISIGHMRALIAAGATDKFGPRRGHMAVVGALPAKDIPIPSMEWNTLERSARQRQALGAPLGEHPFVTLREQLAQVRIPSITGHAEFDEKPTPLSRIPDAPGSMVTVMAIVAGWSERAYNGGRYATVTLEGSNATIRGTIWDAQLTEIKQSGERPNLGDVVLAKARVRMNVIAADPDDPESEDIAVKELTISGIRPVDVIDPAFGEYPPSPLPRLNLVPIPEVEQMPESPAPEPAEPPLMPVQASEPDWGGPMIFDPAFDAPRASTPGEGTVVTAPRNAVSLTPAVGAQPSLPALSAGHIVRGADQTSAPALAPVAVLEPEVVFPATDVLGAAGMLLEADRALGGVGLVGHPSAAVAVAVAPVIPAAGSLSAWCVQVSTAPVPGVQIVAESANDAVHAVLQAGRVRPTVPMKGTEGRSLIITIEDALRGAVGVTWVTLSRDGEPPFQFSIVAG